MFGWSIPCFEELIDTLFYCIRFFDPNMNGISLFFSIQSLHLAKVLPGDKTAINKCYKRNMVLKRHNISFKCIIKFEYHTDDN